MSDTGKFLSRRAYAKHRGCSLSSVQGAIRRGRITVNANNLIDTEKADAAWTLKHQAYFACEGRFLTRRAYAAHRGSYLSTVQLALTSGRISLEDNGLIDPDKADRDWVANTRRRRDSHEPRRRYCRRCKQDLEFGQHCLEPHHSLCVNCQPLNPRRHCVRVPGQRRCRHCKTFKPVEHYGAVTLHHGDPALWTSQRICNDCVPAWRANGISPGGYIGKRHCVFCGNYKSVADFSPVSCPGPDFETSTSRRVCIACTPAWRLKRAAAGHRRPPVKKHKRCSLCRVYKPPEQFITTRKPSTKTAKGWTGQRLCRDCEPNWGQYLAIRGKYHRRQYRIKKHALGLLTPRRSAVDIQISKDCANAARALKARFHKEQLRQRDLKRDREQERIARNKEFREKYKACPQKEVARTAAYKRAHLEQYRTYSETRNERVRETSDGSITPLTIGVLKNATTDCAYCGKAFQSAREKQTDHVTPVCAGGQHSLSNIVIVCAQCNGRKARLTYQEWCDRLISDGLLQDAERARLAMAKQAEVKENLQWLQKGKATLMTMQQWLREKQSPQSLSL